MKALFKILIVLVVLVGLVFAGAFFYVDTIAKKAIEKGGEAALGVPTSLDDLHISLIGGEAELQGLLVANPAGFVKPDFLGLKQGDVAVSLGSLMDDTVRIPRVRLSGIRINLEQKGTRNNIEPILARTKQMAAQGQSTGSSKRTAEGGKKFIVEYFSLTDVQVDADLDLLGQVSRVNLTLPKIELKNLGAKEQGLPLEEVIQQVVQAVLSTVQSSSAQLSPALARLLAGELKGIDGIRSELIGRVQGDVEKKIDDVRQQVKEKIQDVVPATPLNEEVDKAVGEKAGELLKGILGGDKK
jgi:hypothetical protein